MKTALIGHSFIRLLFVDSLERLKSLKAKIAYQSVREILRHIRQRIGTNKRMKMALIGHSFIRLLFVDSFEPCSGWHTTCAGGKNTGVIDQLQTANTQWALPPGTS